MREDRQVYQFTYRDIDDYVYTDIVLADDIFTALAKWRNRITTEKLSSYIVGEGAEPDSIARMDDVEVIG